MCTILHIGLRHLELKKDKMNQTKETFTTEIHTDKSLPFLEQKPNTDLILLVEGKKLYVHKTILAFASPVWAKMLTADFKEKGVSEIELPGKTIRSVVAFLRCVYPDIIDDIDNENVYQVLPLAEEYQCHKLKEKCEKYFVNFLSIQKDVGPALKSLLASCTYDLKESLEASADVLCDRSLSTLERYQLWNEVPTEGKFMVCKKRSKLFEESGLKIRNKLSRITFDVYCTLCHRTISASNRDIVDFINEEIGNTNKTC
ncbi:hypothetical protein KUTeg_007445 [Tegillarca granosa]|uniref:BTB domain-containing protein n=1 Tax=Tegillarca granosa TaxID=220873 RepID=A0ABQ9FGB0_TEGGR|nr:hypothetical protein KUTeg_007445 [Tegillarca granosa]